MTDQDTQFTDKYETSGRIANFLIEQFYAAVIDMLNPRDAGQEILEVGCGAGYSTQYIQTALSSKQRLQATDIKNSLLTAARQRNHGIDFFQSSAYSLPLADKSIDTIIMLEVLEHLEHPELALAELSRVACRRVVISTPREPIWRLLNFARGKYWRSLGNTPGHIQHWSSSGLKQQTSKHFQLNASRTPLPWTILRLTPI